MNSGMPNRPKRQFNKEIEALTNNETDGRIYFDSDGRIFEVSRIFLNPQVFYSSADLLIHELISTESLPLFIIQLEEAEMYGRSGEQKMRLVHFDNCEFICRIFFIDEGSSSYYFARFEKVNPCSLSKLCSPQLRSDQLLQEKISELEKVKYQMDKFLYSTSHDIRSPLTSILGLVSLLRYEITDESLSLYLDMIEGSVSKLDQFIYDLKNFSFNAHQRLESKAIDFEDIVKHTWKKFKYCQADFSFDYEINKASSFFSDSSRIILVLENLIRNSTMFSNRIKGNQLIRVFVEVTEEKALIKVVDNGIGIPKHHLDKIFNMFYRASDQSTGSGLGLYIVKETLLKLNGIINIESEYKKGTTAIVEIPNDIKGKLIFHKRTLATKSETN